MCITYLLLKIKSLKLNRFCFWPEIMTQSDDWADLQRVKLFLSSCQHRKCFSCILPFSVSERMDLWMWVVSKYYSVLNNIVTEVWLLTQISRNSVQDPMVDSIGTSHKVNNTRGVDGNMGMLLIQKIRVTGWQECMKSYSSWMMTLMAESHILLQSHTISAKWSEKWFNVKRH